MRVGIALRISSEPMRRLNKCLKNVRGMNMWEKLNTNADAHEIWRTS